jgi:hypothetical protein
MAFINRLFGLLFIPRREWSKIKNENIGFSRILKTFVGYLIILEISISIIKIFTSGPYKGMTILTSIIFAIVFSFLLIPYIYLSALIINAFAPRFGIKKNKDNAIVLTSYCSVSIIISTLLNFISIKYIGILSLIFLVYIRYSGLKIIMESKRNTFIYALFPDVFLIIAAFSLFLFGTLLQMMLFP